LVGDGDGLKMRGGAEIYDDDRDKEPGFTSRNDRKGKHKKFELGIGDAEVDTRSDRQGLFAPDFARSRSNKKG
jgi:hypothetical protein